MPRSLAIAISGHKTDALYRRYAIVAEADKGIARERMQNYFEALKAWCERSGSNRHGC
jgi:hypothetical protein